MKTYPLKSFGNGTKAFYDTFNGLIPCVVLHSGDNTEKLKIQITKTVNAYKKGEILTANRKDVIPTGYIRTAPMGFLKIVDNFNWDLVK